MASEKTNETQAPEATAPESPLGAPVDDVDLDLGGEPPAEPETEEPAEVADAPVEDEAPEPTANPLHFPSHHELNPGF